MANKEISELTAGSALDGTELFHGVQGGNSRKFTHAELTRPQRILLPEQGSAPTTAAGEGALYTKDSGTQPELFYREESDGGELQLTKNGIPAGTLELVETVSLSGESSVDFETDITSGYDYIISCSNVKNSTDASPSLRFGTGATPTYQTTSYTNQALLTGGTGSASARDNITNGIELIFAAQCGGAATNETWAAEIIIKDAGANARHQVFSEAGFFNSGGSYTMSKSVGQRNATEILTAFRIYLSTGTLDSGRISLLRRRIY